MSFLDCDNDNDWDLPCEPHEIEPGIIFRLTNRNGANDVDINKYPVAPFNNILHRHHVNKKRNRINNYGLFRPSAIVSIINADDSKNDDGERQQQQQQQSLMNENETERILTNNQPLYVNPKQYYRILRRREIRTQLRNRLIRENKGQTLYHVNGRTIKFKSRHKHAKRRLRGPDGKYLSKEAMIKLNKQPKL